MINKENKLIQFIFFFKILSIAIMDNKKIIHTTNDQSSQILIFNVLIILILKKKQTK